ncbi:MAG TPA: hypothetical protein VM659_03655 [Dongiaceae bacterium]|nr:hypothetical protein [Dongiaceae bacterium]
MRRLFQAEMAADRQDVIPISGKERTDGLWGVVVLKLSLFSRKSADPCIIHDDDPAFAIGTVLVESSDFLPRNRFPEWRVIHAYTDRYETPHVVLQNVNEPGSRKSLSMAGLVVSGKYALKEPRTLHS